MFNKETEYAIRGLVYIQVQNMKGMRPGTDEVAENIGAPRFFTAKILQRLVRLGFLVSQKGRGGGFYFTKEKPALTLKKLIQAVEGDQVITGCGFGLQTCSDEHPCPLHERYAPIRKAIDELVSGTTIQSLAISYRGKPLNLERLKL